MASGGSNLSTGNPALRDAVKARIAALQKYPVPAGDVPVDLVTASGSGLDPHISPAAAYYQLPRIAAARGLDPDSVKKLIEEHSQMPMPRFAGEPRVNVLELNMALDKLTAEKEAEQGVIHSSTSLPAGSVPAKY
jgi:K+-transporting ATPase ATPase C chain